MLTVNEITPTDLRAARLFLGLSTKAAAAEAGVAQGTLERMESLDGGHLSKKVLVAHMLHRKGIRFRGVGDMSGAGGEPVPTRQAFGKLTGLRLKRGRRRLGLTVAEVAAAADVNCRLLERFERSEELFVGVKLELYRVLRVLHKKGYRFFKGARAIRMDRVAWRPPEVSDDSPITSE